MNELTSSEFRKQYAKLSEKTAVTVNGHIIGTWDPVEPRLYLRLKDEPPVPQGYIGADPMSQARRDDLLRKINRG